MSEKLKKPAFWLGVLGAIKLAADSFGYQFITDEQVNAISNGLAALFAVAGVIISHDAKTDG